MGKIIGTAPSSVSGSVGNYNSYEEGFNLMVYPY